MKLKLGEYTAIPSLEAPPGVICQDGRLKPHMERPWMRAYMAQQLGAPLEDSVEVDKRVAMVADEALARHTLITGSTGSGKSRVMKHVLLRLWERGCSVVLLDPKGELADEILAHLVVATADPRSVTVLDSRQAEYGVPGWNPLLGDLPLAQTVSDLVFLVEASTTSWGPRARNLLTCALFIAGALRLSLYELRRLLVDDEYRGQLLEMPVESADPVAVDEARAFFIEEFGKWGRSERVQAIAPVLNKISDLLRSGFLRPLLCARRNTLNLADLWQRRRMVIARLDRATLGEEGTRWLSGLFTHSLLRTALRTSGPVPVVLAIDEVPILERFVGKALTDIVTVARSQGLRLLVACQHFAQLSDDLRPAVLANTAVQLFFRLEHADAKAIAASLGVGAEPRITRVLATLDQEDRKTRLPALAEWRHPILDPRGRPLRLKPPVWVRFAHESLFRGASIQRLETLAARSGVSRLYVQAADTGQPVALTRYVAGLTSTECWIDGPALQLVVLFPRPRLTHIERRTETDAARWWTRALQEVPVQHAVLRVGGANPGIVRVVDVPSSAADPGGIKSFLATSLSANGQSAREMAETIDWRKSQIEQGASCRPKPGPRREEEDESIA